MYGDLTTNAGKAKLLNQLRKGLIVSCQALEDEPLYGSEIMALMAKAALIGGAVGIRANSPMDIRSVRRSLPHVPIIGLFKADLPGFSVRITPTLRHAIEIAEAGCDIIALDATDRPHPEGEVARLIEQVKQATGCLVLADISTLAEGLAAQTGGADLVGTTLSGYTDYSPAGEAPDLYLVGELVAHLQVPVIAEGRIATPAQARQALEVGAFAVVVGGAITRPQMITQQFVRSMQA